MNAKQKELVRKFCVQIGWSAVTEKTKVEGWSQFHGVGELKNLVLNGDSLRCHYDNDADTIFVKSLDIDGEHWFDHPELFGR
jgi:hypothetical protein